MKTLKICLWILCLLPFRVVGLPQFSGATFFMKETWKDITGFEGVFQISTLGNVKSLYRKTKNGQGYRPVKERIRAKHFSVKLGYWMISLKSVPLNKEVRVLIHRLVAIAFIPNPENKREVNHKDSDRLNCNVENLEWVTPSENQRHSYDTTDRIGHWTGKVTKIAIPTVAIQDTSIIEFASILKCANYFGVCLNTVRKRMRSGQLLNGHSIYQL